MIDDVPSGGFGVSIDEAEPYKGGRRELNRLNVANSRLVFVSPRAIANTERAKDARPNFEREGSLVRVVVDQRDAAIRQTQFHIPFPRRRTAASRDSFRVHRRSSPVGDLSNAGVFRRRSLTLGNFI